MNKNELLKSATDVSYFARTFINSGSPLALNPVQEYYQNLIKTNKMVYATTARQQGLSSLIRVNILHDLVFKGNFSILLCDLALKQVSFTISVLKKWYERLPKEFQVDVQWNGASIKTSTGVTLTGISSLRHSKGRSPNVVYIDNAEYIKDLVSEWPNIFPCIHYSKLVACSTPEWQHPIFAKFIQ